jgi:hypothetical protein
VWELEHGSPSLTALSNAEWIEWLAILTIVEPEEARRAESKNKR